jgi:sugar lactone lactonase YvrE
LTGPGHWSLGSTLGGSSWTFPSRQARRSRSETRCSITDSGELVDRRVWADLGPGSAPDGICADAEGAIWYASVPGQRCTRVAEGGEVLDTVMADRGCFSCMLGGDDGRRLYIVANHWSEGGASDGVVLVHPVAVRHAGRP